MPDVPSRPAGGSSRGLWIIVLALLALVLALPLASAAGSERWLVEIRDDGYHVPGEAATNPTLRAEPGSHVFVRVRNNGTTAQNLHFGAPLDLGTPIAQRPGEQADLEFDLPADFTGDVATSRHIPECSYVGIHHPGLMGTAPSAALLAKWTKRETDLIATDSIGSKGLMPFMSLPYLSLVYGIHFPFSGFFMLPVWTAPDVAALGSPHDRVDDEHATPVGAAVNELLRPLRWARPIGWIGGR